MNSCLTNTNTKMTKQLVNAIQGQWPILPNENLHIVYSNLLLLPLRIGCHANVWTCPKNRAATHKQKLKIFV